MSATRNLTFVTLIGLGAVTCGETTAMRARRVTLTVFAAASLTDAFTEIGEAFTAEQTRAA